MASGVTPKQIYQALIGQGASTIQAIGIMANMIAESSLDPEAVQQGVSDPGYGLVQWEQSSYARAPSLVTGNPAADMAAQVKFLAQTGGFSAASGSTAAAAAGSFASNYERCATCQPGQTSYNQRVANAATVAGWVSSGKWPTSAGSATAGAAGTGGGGTTSNSTDPTCAWGFSGSLVVTSVNLCVVRKTTIRHAVGGLLLAGGGIVVIAGAIILAASAFQRSGAQSAVIKAAEVVPGAAPVARGARRSTTAGRPRTQQRSP